MKTTKEKIEVMQAFVNGKAVEWRDPIRYNKWEIAVNPSWDWNNIDYRIAPEKKRRPWKLEEIPLNALFKSEVGNIYRIGSVIEGQPRFCGFEDYTDHFVKNTLSYTYSTDGGKTWLPCGVEE